MVLRLFLTPESSVLYNDFDDCRILCILVFLIKMASESLSMIFWVLVTCPKSSVSQEVTLAYWRSGNVWYGVCFWPSNRQLHMVILMITASTDFSAFWYFLFEIEWQGVEFFWIKMFWEIPKKLKSWKKSSFFQRFDYAFQLSREPQIKSKKVGFSRKSWNRSRAWTKNNWFKEKSKTP